MWRSCKRSSSNTGCPEPSNGYGLEFTLKRLDQAVYLNEVDLDFSRLGNPFIEAYNGRYRKEYLNENWFLSLEDAAEKVESWRRH